MGDEIQGIPYLLTRPDIEHMDNLTPASPDHDPDMQSGKQAEDKSIHNRYGSYTNSNNFYTNPNNVPPPPRAALPSNPYSHPAYNMPPPVNYRNQPFPPIPNPVSAGSGKAVISLTVSLMSVLGMWFIPVVGLLMSIGGIVFGHKAISDMNPYSSTRGMAIGGLICGYVSLLLSLLVTGVWFLWNVPDWL